MSLSICVQLCNKWTSAFLTTTPEIYIFLHIFSIFVLMLYGLMLINKEIYLYQRYHLCGCELPRWAFCHGPWHVTDQWEFLNLLLYISVFSWIMTQTEIMTCISAYKWMPSLRWSVSYAHGWFQKQWTATFQRWTITSSRTARWECCVETPWFKSQVLCKWGVSWYSPCVVVTGATTPTAQWCLPPPSPSALCTYTLSVL